ncbi:MAG: transglutaminase family protein [Bacteroidetes bacterium]|nr:transglutaminase family protein [Bacteroidota bacterium]
MRYQIAHTTEYQYHQTVSLCHNIAMLIPRNTDLQECRKTIVKINPQPDVMNEYEDFFGNKVLYFAVQQEHSSLKVTVLSQVEKFKQRNLKMELYNNIPWENVSAMLQEPGLGNFEARQFIPATSITNFTKEIHEYAQQSFTPGRSLFDAAWDLVQRMYRDFEFKTGFTTVATPLTEVMEQRKGVCQDFAHLAIACIRSMGLPARYVSGYIETIAPAGKEKLVGVDASHAWFSVYIPQSGWIDFDPTNNLITSDQHITIGWGRDYADLPPLKGVILSTGSHKLDVSVDVRRLD